MTDRQQELEEIALTLAEQHIQDFDFLGVAEQQDELGLTDDELAAVHDMVIDAEVSIREVLTW